MYEVASGFLTPRGWQRLDRDLVSRKLNSVYRPVFALISQPLKNTKKNCHSNILLCLFIDIYIRIHGLMIADSGLRKRAFNHSLMTRKLILSTRGCKKCITLWELMYLQTGMGQCDKVGNLLSTMSSIILRIVIYTLIPLMCVCLLSYSLFLNLCNGKGRKEVWE